MAVRFIAGKFTTDHGDIEDIREKIISGLFFLADLADFADACSRCSHEELTRLFCSDLADRYIYVL